MRKIADWISKMHPLEILFRGMLFSIGLLFFAGAAWQTFESIQIIATHEKFVAEVTRCHTAGSPNARLSTYGCEVKYQSSAGRHSASIDNLLLKYEEGDQIDIYVGTGLKYSVKAGGFMGLWGVPTLLTIIGALFFGYGVWPYKEDKKPQSGRHLYD